MCLCLLACTVAPEIIEMSGPSASCDIWSVGCLVIELLTGKPPYFDLPPMAALFRIVQDDYPPIPDTVSPALKDFLAECFRKEPSFRKSAVDLLKHPWVTIPLKGGDATAAGAGAGAAAGGGGGTVTAAAVAAAAFSKVTSGSLLDHGSDRGPGAAHDTLHTGAELAAKHTSMSLRVSREELEAVRVFPFFLFSYLLCLLQLHKSVCVRCLTCRLNHATSPVPAPSFPPLLSLEASSKTPCTTPSASSALGLQTAAQRLPLNPRP